MYAEVESSLSHILEQLLCKMKPSVQELDTKKDASGDGTELKTYRANLKYFCILGSTKKSFEKEKLSTY